VTVLAAPSDAAHAAAPPRADHATVSRATALYGVHAYHTKVPPEGVEPFVLEHSPAGGVVLDPFCGSGMTGVAARRLGRRPILFDLSPAAVHITKGYLSQCETGKFRAATERIASRCEDERALLYRCTCHRCGGSANTAYVIWSDVRACPSCSANFRLWEQRATGLRRLTCPACGTSFVKALGKLVGEAPVSVSLDCVQCGRVEREPTEEDRMRCATSLSGVANWYPRVDFGRNREMWRVGHADLGISTVADFYSPRNLRALAALWAAIHDESDHAVRHALEFTFTAIVNRASRRYQWNAKRPTNVLGGTLYVSSLRYEFNVFDLWRRKVAAVRRYLLATQREHGHAIVAQATATALPLADASIDYCFTDPPFGANIVYSDCSLLWEAWLDRFTSDRHQAVIHRHRKVDDGGKALPEYATLMALSLREIHRVLKPGARATVVFQNTHGEVWEAILEAITSAGFGIEAADTLHKSQPSFKGVKAQLDGERVAASDVVLTLSRAQGRSGSGPARTIEADLSAVWSAVEHAIRAAGGSRRSRSTGHLYAIALAAALNGGMQPTTVSFERVEAWLRERCREVEGSWRFREGNDDDVP